MFYVRNTWGVYTTPVSYTHPGVHSTHLVKSETHSDSDRITARLKKGDGNATLGDSSDATRT